jgi:hypothetical protein
MAEKHTAQVISIKEAYARVKAEKSARLRAQRRFAARNSEREQRHSLDPRWIALLRLAIMLVVVVGVVFLVRELRSVSKLQDCVMEGRTNCAPIDIKSLHSSLRN